MSVLDHPRVVEVRAALAAAGATGAVRELSAEAHTAAAAARELAVPVGAIADTRVLDADGHPLLVLTSGAHRVDHAKVAGLLGVRSVVPATPGFLREHTGQADGGVAPLGHPHPIGTLVDLGLARHPTVWAAAGHPGAVFPTSFDELLQLTAGTPAEVDDPDGGPAPAPTPDEARTP